MKLKGSFARYYLLICLLLNIYTPYLGFASQPKPTLSTHSPPYTEIPFSIDKSEVIGGVWIASPAGRTFVNRADKVKHWLTKDVMAVYLFDGKGSPVAYDVVAKGFKQTLLFNAINTARADVMMSLVMAGLEGDRWKSSYRRIDRHPKFNKLVEPLRSAKRLAKDDYDLITTISVEIALDMLKQMRQEQEKM